MMRGFCPEGAYVLMNGIMYGGGFVQGGFVRGGFVQGGFVRRGFVLPSVWGCMSGRGVGQLYRCEGTMWQDQYVRVLRNHMLPSASSLYGEGEATSYIRCRGDVLQ